MAEQDQSFKSAVYARLWKISFAVFVTAVLVFILLSVISFEDFLKSLSMLSLPFIILAAAFHILSYVFRSFRFKLLLSGSLRFRDLFPIVCIHNLMNYIIPARLGELSYLHMIRKQKIPVGKNVASFAIARIFDVICVSVIFFIGAIMVKDAPEFVILGIYAICLLLLIIFIIIMLLLFKGKVLNKKIDVWKKKVKVKFLKKVMEKMNEIIHSFQILKERNVAGKTFLFSMLIWFFLYLSMYLLLLDLGLSLDFSHVLIAITFPVVVTILPIHGVGGYGTSEVGWVVPLMAFGVASEKAISSGFIIHTFQLLLVIILGIFGYLFYRKKK